MSSLQTQDLIALSFLINEDVYLVNEGKHQEKETPLLAEMPTQEVKNTHPIKDFKYLGENNKYILIVVKEPNFDFLKPDDLTFLLKILAAKKLELKDVAIVNCAQYESLNFDDLKSFFGFNKVITFGIDPKILQIENAVANKKSIFKNAGILGTWQLAQLGQDVNKKTIFWNELKTF